MFRESDGMWGENRRLLYLNPLNVENVLTVILVICSQCPLLSLSQVS